MGNEGKQTIEEDIATIKTKVMHLESGQAEIKDLIVKQYVTQQEFSPVRLIVYGMVGIILITVLTSLVALVLHNIK
jgi:hypothetical protein